jgi:N-acylneuraminate cytidylyltransferase
MRDAQLARSETPMVPVIIDAIQRVQQTDGPYDCALMLQANSPLSRIEDIEAVLYKITSGECDVVFTVSEVSHPPQWTITVENGRPDFAFVDVQSAIGERRQDQKPLFRSTGAIYAINVRYLFSHADSARLCLPAAGQRSGVVITDVYSSTDIDSELDFFVAETIQKTQRSPQ